MPIPLVTWRLVHLYHVDWAGSIVFTASIRLSHLSLLSEFISPLVHDRYVMRLRRKIHFEERKQANQRRVLSDFETVKWLNHAVEKMWPVCMEQSVSHKILLPIVPWFRGGSRRIVQWGQTRKKKFLQIKIS